MTRGIFYMAAIVTIVSLISPPGIADARDPARVQRGSPSAGSGTTLSLRGRFAQAENPPTQPSAGTVVKKDGDQCGTPHAFEKRALADGLLHSKASFALDILTRLSPNAPNVSISPFGLSAVLSTLYLGANPSMRKAIAATLRIDAEEDGGKFDGLRREARLIALASHRDERRFASFNGVFVDHRLPLKPGISDLAMADGEVELQSVDFGSQSGIDSVNALLAKKTNGRITSILEPGSIPSLVAANAFVFKDCWKTTFDKSNTANKPFTRVDGSKVERPTMSVTLDSIGYYSNGQFAAVELPYLDEDFALMLVTTRRGPAKIADFKGAASLLAGLELGEARVSLSLPKFGGSTDDELLEVLSGMGLKPGLLSGNQLPGFAEGLKLGRVRQKTWLIVDERGTEATAVTAAEATRSAEQPKAVSITFDKPFVYALRHRPTGAILMAGYVGDPGEEKQAKKE